MISLSTMQQIVELSQARNYRRAATKLGIRHSTISQAVAKLEDQYGVPLFVKHGQETVPTVFGETLLTSARKHIAEFENTNREIRLMQNLDSGELVIGADPRLSEDVVAPVLVKFLQKYPAMQVTVSSLNWDLFETQLLTGSIDLYVGVIGNLKTDSFEYSNLSLIPPIMVGHQDHPLSSYETVGMNDLDKYRVVAGNTPAWLSERFVEMYPDRFDDLPALRAAFLSIEDFQLRKALVTSGFAVGYLPAASIAGELKTGSLVKLKLDPDPLESGFGGSIVTLASRPLSPAVAVFSNELRRRAHHLASQP